MPRQCTHWLAMTGFCSRYRLYSRQRRSRWNVRRRERETVDLLMRSCWAIWDMVMPRSMYSASISRWRGVSYAATARGRFRSSRWRRWLLSPDWARSHA